MLFRKKHETNPTSFTLPSPETGNGIAFVFGVGIFIMEEIWKDIQGYEGLYQVSNLGRIKRLCYHTDNLLLGVKSFYKERIKKLSSDKDGYLWCTLWSKEKSKLLRVHRAVCTAFIPNHENKPCVNHKNGIKNDNRLENLEWVTRSENDLHAYRTGLRTVNKTALGKTGYESSTGKVVMQYDKNKNFIREFGSIRQAEQILKIKHISSVCRGKRKYSGGFIWRYKND